ncbi:MAG: entericidin A/B family lipoprotein [Janthinobacterium lividum]
MLSRTLLAALILAAALPLLSACNTVAGAGQDVSAGGAAVSRSATDVKRGL